MSYGLRARAIEISKWTMLPKKEISCQIIDKQFALKFENASFISER